MSVFVCENMNILYGPGTSDVAPRQVIGVCLDSFSCNSHVLFVPSFHFSLSLPSVPKVRCLSLHQQVLLTMATDEGDEAFDSSCMGTAEEVVNERVGDNDFVFIKGCSASKVGGCE